MEINKKLTLDNLQERVSKSNPVCICGATLAGSRVKHYGPHDGGIAVEGFDEKRWIYVTCTRCGYDMAIWKIMRDL